MNRHHGLWTLLVAAAAAFASWTSPDALHAQQEQTGIIQGTITDVATGQPLPAVQVTVVGTQRGTMTARDGTYRIVGVAAGDRQVRAQSLGYASSTLDVTVGAGQTVNLNFQLRQTVLDIEEIVVTGVAGATPRAKLPFVVDRLTAEALPVPAPSAASMLQGKVAGAQVVAGTGRPGAAPTILLRGPTSINASGRSQEPLYIVDGVILGSSMVDIDALDIESIEVVKGAAAASLYGSRAANGVVQIVTRRGQNVGDDMVRYTVRSEFGQSALPGRFNLTQRHAFRMNEAGTRFLDANGNECDWLNCPSVGLAGQRAVGGASANNWNSIQSQSWPGTTYDHVDRFFRSGDFMQTSASVEGRSGGTNYHVSFSNLDESGVMPGQEGFQRNNFRLNVDQSVRSDVTLSATTFYSRSTQNAFPESQGNPIFNLTRMPAGVDLSARDENGELILEPDPFNENANPLYEMLNRNYEVRRGRFLGSVTARWSPLSWFDLEGNFSYDRLDYFEQDHYPKGFRTIRPNSALNEGNLWRYNSTTEAMNTSVTAMFRRTFGDLATRTQVRYLFERNDDEWTSASGSQFAVADVITFGNIDQERVSAGSGLQPTRAEGFYLITDMDWRDRYIMGVQVRRDGSSRFGPDEREHIYYRGALAYRVSEEDWFNLPNVNEFKLRYSYGTAGNTPNFAAQYETYSVSAGSVSPVTLGNRNLKPEFSAEQEFGIDMIIADRYSLDLTYATTETRDQILNVPALAYTGFVSQWQNAGTLQSNTFEASLGAQLVRTQDFNWSARVLFDRTRQEITELNVPAFTYGVGGQNMGAVFYAREGESLGTFYGTQFAENCGHLPEGVDCSQFQVNDDGFLVWVGGAGSFRNGWDTYVDGEGNTRNWWGTAAPFTIRGQTLLWGTPFAGEDFDPISGERVTRLPVGNTQPDYSIGFSNNLSYRGLQLYALFEAVQGFDVYNQPIQWSTFQSYSGIMDQSGRPEAEQKPVGYYIDGLYGNGGGLAVNSAFVQDASFVKLRELSLRYRAGADRLQSFPVLRGFEGMTFSLTGRNLITWSDYDGYDPEVGRGGGSTGSAALARVDGYNYPNFRTWTFGLELNF